LADHLPNVLRWAGTYLTGREIWGKAASAEEIHASLADMSVYDVLALVGSMSASLVIEPDSASAEAQAELASYLAIEDENLVANLARGLSRGQVLIHTQQLYHLARLAVLCADSRDADALGGGEFLTSFHKVLFGIGDLMSSKITGNPDIISLELRLTALNHDEERLGQWSFYHELFDRIWPTVEGAPDADQAFAKFTGLSIAEYLALGFAVSAGLTRKINGRPIARLDIANWLAQIPIEEKKREAFLAVTGGTVDELRAGLIAEQESHGATTYASLSIEKRPLVRRDEQLYVSNFAAYERRATHGIFHLLSEGSEKEGLSREAYTAPFGAAFQIWVENALRRVEESSAGVEIFADVPYGTKREPRDTSDVVLVYERNIIVIEVVAGALRIGSLTHGDLEMFNLDLEKFVFKKARQLTKRIADMRAGLTEKIGITVEQVSTIWPVIVTSAPFPVRPAIMESIRGELKTKGLLRQKGTGTISIIGAEELAGLEGYLAATGETALDVIRGWKANARTGDMYLKNFLFERFGGPIPRSAHFGEMFDELSERSHRLLFGAAGKTFDAPGTA
jgi:hypothetical protein